MRKLPARSKSKGRKVKEDDTEEKVEKFETKEHLRVPKINTTDLKVQNKILDFQPAHDKSFVLNTQEVKVSLRFQKCTIMRTQSLFVQST